MEKRRVEARRRRRNNYFKALAAAMSVVLVIGGIVGGTLAWLKATSGPVTNTFTTSGIDVTLSEEAGGESKEFKMVPGWTIDKDPKVMVTEGSEDCYLFVKVTESANLDSYIKYAIDSRWTALTDADKDGFADDGVYYMVFDSKDTSKNKPEKGTSYGILGAGTYTFTNGTADDTTDDIPYTWAVDQVLTLPEVTESDMTAAETSKPTLTFTAYAVQLYKSENAKFEAFEAWALAQNLSGN